MKTIAKPYRTMLRRALLGNACFSAASGLILLLDPALVGNWLDFDSPVLFRLLGAGLLLFAAELLYQGSRESLNQTRAWMASLADFGWVVASGLLPLLFPDALSSRGWAIVIGVALVVLVFGGIQIHALRGLNKPGGKTTTGNSAE